jgi:hypothetical protein
VRLTTPRFSGRGSPPAIGFLSTGYGLSALAPAQRAGAQRLCALCRFLDAGNNETLRTLREPASKKRQGTKSRAVGRWLAASAMGIMCRCRARWWAGGEHDATCMSARAGCQESAEGISAGAWSASTGDGRTDGCDWVERDRRRRGASASGRESGNAHRRSGS